LIEIGILNIGRFYRGILDRKRGGPGAKGHRTGNGQGYRLHIRCAAPGAE
jgi:hypothetical protein